MKKSVWLIVIIVSNIATAFAGVEPEIKSYMTGSALAVITPLPNIETYDAVLFNSGGSSSGTSPSIYSGLLNARNLIWLEINQAQLNDCLTDSFSFSLRVKIERKDKNGSALADEYDTLFVSYNKYNGKSYNDKHSVVYYGGYYCKVTVLSISDPGLVDYVQLNNSILIERYKSLNTSTIPNFNVATISYTDGTIEVDWNTLVGAEEYDLEWTFVDDYGNPSSAFGSGATLDADEIEWQFHLNSTRVTVKDNSYKITIMNDHGFLLVRVRGVGRTGTIFTHRVEGAWSSDAYGPLIDNSSGTSFTMGEDAFHFVYETAESGLLGGSGIVKIHEPTLNWQYTSTFAEYGKRKEVVGYNDGSMRNRQMVTKINSEETAVAGETVYDYQGRQAGSFLPVPTFENRLKFYPNFNLSAWSGKNYGPKDFDSSLNHCADRFVAPLDESSGAGMYYSANNPLSGELHYEYVPNAQGYAFTVTEYMPDGTGRVRRQSGVGQDHKLGSGHETKYFYGTPDQIELDRLFGTAVGYSQHYQKNMVVDPNGQVSVSYLDLQGRVVATALAGATPENLQTLDNADTDSTLQVTIPVDFKSDVFDNRIETSKQITVPVEDDHVFNYSIEVPRHTEVSQPVMCFDCIYDLEIKLLDECGENILDADPGTGGIQTLVKTVGKPIAQTEWDVACSTVVYNFSLDDQLDNSPITVHLEVGSYTLLKTLKINEEAYSYYEEQFLTDNDSIRTLEQFKEEFIASADFGQCETNCDSCYSKLGSWSTFLANELERLSAEGIAAGAEDSAAIYSTYRSLSTHCAELCLPVEKSCDMMLDIMIADVSPGGQYAPIKMVDGEMTYGGILTSETDLEDIENLGFNYIYSWVNSGDIDKFVYIDYRDSNGNLLTVNIDGVDKEIRELTVEEYVLNFKSTWANSLVKYHPEYCKYQLCMENEAAEDYERRMLYVTGFQEALDSGFLNPLDTLSPFSSNSKDPYFRAGGNGYTDKLAFSGLLNSYTLLDDSDPACTPLSVWNLSKVTYLCNYDNCDDVNTCLSSNSWESISCTPTLDNIWIMFRSIYLAERRKLIENNYPETCPRTSAMSGFIERFPTINKVESEVFLTGTNYGELFTESNDKFIAECDTNCMYNADIWIGKLRDCGWNSTDSANFRAQLIAVCQNACDAEHPYGASSHPNTWTKRKTVEKSSYTSFQAVFDDYVSQGKMEFKAGACDINTIGFPMDYDHNYTKFVDNDGEPCTKDGYEPPSCTQAVSNSGLADMYKRQYRQKQPDSTKCEKCITCREMHTALSTVETEYGGSIDEDNVEIREAITISLNRQLNFNLGWLDYYDFMMKCGEFTSADSNVIEMFLDLWVMGSNIEDEPSGQIYLRPKFKYDYNKTPQILLASTDELYTITGDSITLNDCICKKLADPALEATLSACINGFGGSYIEMKTFCEQFYQLNNNAPLTSTSVWTENSKRKLKNVALSKRLYVPEACFIDNGCSTDRPSNETNPFYSRYNPNPPSPGSGSSGGSTSLPKPDSTMLTSCDSIKRFMHIMDSICVVRLTCTPSFKNMVKSYLFDKNSYFLSTNLSLLNSVNNAYDSMFPHLKKDTRFGSDPLKKFLAMLHLYNECIRESYYVYDPNCCKQPNKYAKALMATLNKMVSDYDPIFGNRLTYDNQKLYPWVPQYYNSKLYNGAYKTTVKFGNDPYNIPDLVIKFTDSLTHNRKVILSYTDNLYNEAEWSFIVKVKNFKLITLDYLCDSTSRFELTAVQMTSWGEQEVKISGYFPGINLGDTCDENPSLKLCDRNYWDSHIEPDTNDCNERIEEWAEYMAQRSYDEYIRLQKKGFRERYLAKCLNGFSGESLTITKPDHEYHYTLYYYDQAGNLIQTVPPAGVLRISNSTTLASVISNRNSDGSAVIPSHNLKTNYEFNSLNQLIKQNTPDGGQSKFWYDNLGRLVVSQNAKQYAMSPKAYSYTIFDALGRIREVGQLQNSTTMTVAIAFDQTNLGTFINAVSKTEVTRSIYDLTSGSFPSSTHFVQQNLRSRVSSIQYFPTLGSGLGASGTYTQAVHYTYDIHGNVDVLLRELPALSAIGQDFKSVIYKYDLVSGNVNQVLYQYGQVDMFAHKYIYDADNRVTEAYTSHDLLQWDRDAQYNYYLHGPMSRTVLGGLSVQGIDFAYTLHGWLKGVNSTTLRTSRDIGRDGEGGADNQFVAKDVYGYSLGFFEGDQTPIGLTRASSPLQNQDLFTPLTTTSALGRASDDLWNGNIRHMVTAIKPYMAIDGMPMARAYRYDQLNRIKDAYTYDAVELDSNLWKYTGSANLDYEEHFSFDPNGNMLTLSRNGTNKGGYSRDMDNFTYHYTTNTNKLTYVDDSKASGNYADDIDDQSSGNYTYDAIGNLISDASEQIASIEWTVYGKIKSITRTGGSSKPNLEFEYSPDGHRVIKKSTTSDGNITYSYYIRDAQGNVMSVYSRHIDVSENDTLVWSEAHIYGSSRLGVYRPNKKLYGNGNAINNYISGNGSINKRGNKSYELSNHLGNVLVVITDKRTSVCDEEDEILAYDADITDATDYYAYGSPMPLRQGLQTCEVVSSLDTVTTTVYSETFSSGSTGSFTAGTGSITVSNVYPGQLKIESFWTYRPKATSPTFSVVAGKTYKINIDLVTISAGTGKTHTVRVRVYYPGGNTFTDYTSSGTKTFTFTPGSSGNAYVDISSTITPSSGGYSPGNPNVIIDNVSISYDSSFTIYDTVCNYSKNGYRYGFNGKRIDEGEEGMGGGGSTYDYGFRIYNPNLGRFLSVDPLFKDYSFLSPYIFAENKVIECIDLDGLESVPAGKIILPKTPASCHYTVPVTLRLLTADDLKPKKTTKIKVFRKDEAVKNIFYLLLQALTPEKNPMPAPPLLNWTNSVSEVTTNSSGYKDELEGFGKVFVKVEEVVTTKVELDLNGNITSITKTTVTTTTYYPLDADGNYDISKGSVSQTSSVENVKLSDRLSENLSKLSKDLEASVLVEQDHNKEVTNSAVEYIGKYPGVIEKGAEDAVKKATKTD